MKILACIVTFNRAALLERCVDAVRAQTRPPDRLLVINNGSTDGTVSMLDAKGVDCLTQDNVGSAGGWARSIAEAQEGGYDAVWLMDDDGFPAPDALALLERHLTGDRVCVSSVVLREDDPSHFVFPFPLLNRNGWPVLFARPRKIPTLEALRPLAKDGLYPFAHLFNGALLSVAATRRIGNVNRDYFLFGDEVDYFARMRQLGPVLSHLDAHHLHPDVSQRELNQTKVYYYVKNTLILNKRYHDLAPVRNAATPLVALARVAARNSPAEALSYVIGKRAPILWKAVSRGLTDRIGKDL
ncbi:glycosyltransferase [Sphingomonas humi]|uniref:Glycosyltransferase family 2 protein n=1 Tax=Sphingomonas humi TaxID=335630 RepID=A0ABP7SDE0_9SPHN